MSEMMLSFCRCMISIFLIILLIEVIPSEEIKWTSIPGSVTYAHKGENKNLIWEFSEEGDEIIRLEWYFKSALICFSSDNGYFEIEPSYQGRIERIGKSGLLLKNVSIDDEGIYTLNLVRLWSLTIDMQNITLQILALPINNCSYNITCTRQLKGVTCDIMLTDCGGQEESAVRKRRTTQSILLLDWNEHFHENIDLKWAKKTLQSDKAKNYGHYLYFNLESHEDELFFCANKKAVECVDGFQHNCASIPIQPTVDEFLPRSNNNTLQGQLFTTPALKDICTCASLQHCDNSLYILISCAVLILAILLFFILLLMNRKWMCIKKLENEMLEMHQQYMQKDYMQTRPLKLRDRKNNRGCANDLGSDPSESEDNLFEADVQRGGISQGGINHLPKEHLLFHLPAVS